MLPESLVSQYLAIEQKVQRLMTAACAPFCSACPLPCCRPQMCKEALDSPFLVQVRRLASPRSRWLSGKGWLGKSGCRLAGGRPPVCYEFLCRRILEGQPDDWSRERLKRLAYILTDPGRRALGPDHLVEIITPERLALVKPQRLERSLTRARAELKLIVRD